MENSIGIKRVEYTPINYWSWSSLHIYFSHLFAIASTAYGRMMKNTENQVIVIR